MVKRVKVGRRAPPPHQPEAEFLDEIQNKVSRVFLLVIHRHPYSFVYFFKLTQTLTVSVKEKGRKPDRKPYPLPSGIRNPYRNLKYQKSQKIMPRNLNVIVRS
jgi:hypothetical protein